MRGFVPNEAMINFVSLEQTAKLYAAVMGYWLYLREFLRQPWIEVRYEDIVGDFCRTDSVRRHGGSGRTADGRGDRHHDLARHFFRDPTAGDRIAGI